MSLLNKFTVLGCSCLLFALAQAKLLSVDLKNEDQWNTFSHPIIIVCSVILGLILSIYGASVVADGMKDIHSSVRYESASYESLYLHPGFKTHSHRGEALSMMKNS